MHSTFEQLNRPTSEQVPVLLLSLDAVLFSEEQRELVSSTPSPHISAIQRARERTSRNFDSFTSDGLTALTNTLKQKFKAPNTTGKVELFTFPTADLNPGQLRWLDIRPVTWPNLETERSSAMEIDYQPINNGRSAARTITPPQERVVEPKPVASFLNTETSLLSKKPRNILYKKPNSTNEIDLSRESDSSDTPQIIELGFKTAREKYDEDAARDGKPPLPTREREEPADKKKGKRTIDEIAGWHGPEDDEKIAALSSKRRTPMTNITSSVVSKSSKPLHTPASNGAPKSNGTNGTNGANSKASGSKDAGSGISEEEKELYKGIDPEIAERVLNEILDTNMNVKWTDIAGLEDVKETLREMIILPNLHPEMFTGLRAPPRGLLLFGPPGNGKTMIAKAIATEAGLTFFSISASVLCSKWIGEGEKTMRALFTIARAKAPSFIFIDEVDSILCSRSSEEHESSRRLKNEFLTQFDGATSSAGDAVTIMGATNRPFDLDDAARRRMPKRIYVPLPEQATRYNLLAHLLKGENHCLSQTEVDGVAERLVGYSCSDIHQLSQQAAMGPVRDKMRSGMMTGSLRAIKTDDFDKAIETTRPSVAPEECKLYEDFADKFGTKGL